MSLRPLSKAGLPFLLLYQLEMGVGQDAGQGAEDPQRLRARRAEVTGGKGCDREAGRLEKTREEKSGAHLVEGQRVVEEQVTSNQGDAKLEMTEHVVADRRDSQGKSDTLKPMKNQRLSEPRRSPGPQRRAVCQDT